MMLKALSLGLSSISLYRDLIAKLGGVKLLKGLPTRLGQVLEYQVLTL